MIRTQYPDPIPCTRGDTLMLFFPLVHVDATGAVTSAFTAEEAQAFDARWTVRRLQARSDPDDLQPALDVPGGQIQVMADTTPPGVYVEAAAADTKDLVDALRFDVELQEVRPNLPNLVWTFVSGTLDFSADVTRYAAAP